MKLPPGILEVGPRRELTQLTHVAAEVERALAPPATRLEALARLLVELPYGEFVEMAAGIAQQGRLDGEMPHRELSQDLARLIHGWAVHTLAPGLGGGQ
jgi:hypothetical protein